MVVVVVVGCYRCRHCLGQDCNGSGKSRRIADTGVGGDACVPRGKVGGSLEELKSELRLGLNAMGAVLLATSFHVGWVGWGGEGFSYGTLMSFIVSLALPWYVNT